MEGYTVTKRHQQDLDYIVIDTPRRRRKPKESKQDRSARVAKRRTEHIRKALREIERMASSDRHSLSSETLAQIAIALHEGVADITRAAAQHNGGAP
jgi:hypothetical protein